MRDIEFRGKVQTTGEWVRGDLMHITETEGSIISNEVPYRNGCFAVYMDTVGQYTGLKDKNGVKIFEGDIVRVIEDNPCNPFDPCVRIYPVVFINGCFLWDGECIGRCIEDGYELEVIGNIHDNPELLNEK